MGMRWIAAAVGLLMALTFGLLAVTQVADLGDSGEAQGGAIGNLFAVTSPMMLVTVAVVGLGTAVAAASLLFRR